MAVKQFHEDTLVRCSNYQEGRAVCSSESSDVPVMEVDSAVQDEGLHQNGNNRFVLYMHAGRNKITLRPFIFWFQIRLKH